jgi:hypothetical protein
MDALCENKIQNMSLQKGLQNENSGTNIPEKQYIKKYFIT